MVFLFQCIHVLIALAHLFPQLFIVFFLGPVVAGAVLYPFEIGTDHAADVAHDVGEDFDAVGFEIGICFFCGGSVGAFEDQVSFDFAHGLFVQLIFHGCYENDIHILSEEFIIRNHHSALFGIAFEGTAVAVRIGVHGFDIEALWFVPSAIDIADGGDFHALLVHQERAYGAYIAEALHDHGQVFHVLAILFAPGFQCEEEAAAGGFVSAERTAGDERLAGDDAGLPFAGESRIFISNPRHDLAIGIHIGSRHVLVRSDDGVNFANIAAGEARQFSLGEFVRIHFDAAFGTAIRNISDSILNGHPSR